MAVDNVISITTFTELIEDYKGKESEAGFEGIRSFYADNNGTDTLPVIGTTPFDSAHPEAICRGRDFDIFYPDPDDRSKWLKKYVCEFATKPRDGDVRHPNLEERRFQLGGEIIAIDEPSGWTWDLASENVTQPLFLSNLMGSFTRQMRINSDGGMENWITNRLEVQAGTINDQKFEGFREGAVLFSGVSGGTQNDENGAKFWLFDLEFTFRIVRAGGGLDYDKALIVKDDWLYLWNKDGGGGSNGVWDRPKFSDGTVTKFLYDKTNFNNLFSGTQKKSK